MQVLGDWECNDCQQIFEREWGSFDEAERVYAATLGWCVSCLSLLFSSYAHLVREPNQWENWLISMANTCATLNADHYVHCS